MPEEIVDRRRQKRVRLHQPSARGHDAVPVAVRVRPEGNVEGIFHRAQLLHGPRRGAVHPDLAVPVGGHERERRVHGPVDHFEVQPVHRRQGVPERDVRAAHRVDSDMDLRVADRLHIDDVFEVADIGKDIVDRVNPLRNERPVPGNPAHRIGPGGHQFIRPVLDPRRGFRRGRPSFGRIVLEAAVFGRIVRRRDDDAVREAALLAPVVDEDRARDHGRRREAFPLLDHDVDVICGEDLDGRPERRQRERVRVHPEKKRSRRP